MVAAGAAADGDDGCCGAVVGVVDGMGVLQLYLLPSNRASRCGDGVDGGGGCMPLARTLMMASSASVLKKVKVKKKYKVNINI